METAVCTWQPCVAQERLFIVGGITSRDPITVTETGDVIDLSDQGMICEEPGEYFQGLAGTVPLLKTSTGIPILCGGSFEFATSFHSECWKYSHNSQAGGWQFLMQFYESSDFERPSVAEVKVQNGTDWYWIIGNRPDNGTLIYDGSAGTQPGPQLHGFSNYG